LVIISKPKLNKTRTSASEISDTVVLILKDRIRDIANMRGARIPIRIIIIYAFCTFVTSVVRRVTRLDAENLSILANEKSCIE
jgi:hypothetical protein